MLGKEAEEEFGTKGVKRERDDADAAAQGLAAEEPAEPADSTKRDRGKSFKFSQDLNRDSLAKWVSKEYDQATPLKCVRMFFL